MGKLGRKGDSEEEDETKDRLTKGSHCLKQLGLTMITTWVSENIWKNFQDPLPPRNGKKFKHLKSVVFGDYLGEQEDWEENQHQVIPKQTNKQ